MSEVAGDRLVFLEALDFPGAPDRPIPSCWHAGFGRHEGDDLIARLHRLETSPAGERGYLESIRQRLRIWEACEALPEPVSVLLREGADHSAAIAAYVPDGEPLPICLERKSSFSDGEMLHLLRSAVDWLEALALAPRILANLELSDFLVHVRDGWAAGLTLCPLGAILREEASLSDHRLATLWTERIAGAHERIKPHRRGLAERLSGKDRPFRPLLKQLESGRDRPLVEHFAELGKVIDREIAATGWSEEDRTLFTVASFPRGPLASFLEARATESDADLYGKPDEQGRTTPLFSPYTIASRSLDGSRPCVGLLLAPEAWFQHSLIDCLNRRLSHPFLKSHHHCLRVRSVYCDDRVTVLRTDPSPGVPLPTLLAAGKGISARDLLSISQKLHRALAQFESAGFDLELDSPWQIELHLEAGVPLTSWDSLLRGGLSTWPSWSIILRCERPVESLLPGLSNASWDWMLQRLDLKFFPALVSWMHEWKRLQDSAATGTLTAAALSADAKLAALFEAASVHLDPTHPGQRAKFLALLEEGLLGDSTLSGRPA